MDPIPPTLPFHLAKAYGVKPASPARAAVTVTPIAPGVDRIDTARPATSGTDKADLASAKKTATLRERLVAAVVPGGVSFENGSARPSTPVVRTGPATDRLPFYRHPADKNAAATAIDLGSRIDTSG